MNDLPLQCQISPTEQSSWYARLLIQRYVNIVYVLKFEAYVRTQKVKGNVENWKIHMNGLKQMVELRGGIQAFDSKRMVRNKIHR